MATLSTLLTTLRTGSRAAKKTAPSTARIETHGKYTWVETGVRCPACGKELSYSPYDQNMVECGGPGEGGCAASMLAYSLGTPTWKEKCEEFMFLTDGAKLPSLKTCMKIQPAMEQAASIGKKVWAKR